MTTKIRLWIAGASVAAVAGLIGLVDTSYAGTEEEIRNSVIKIAGLLKKGDKAGAQQAAAAAAKKIEDMADLMHMFRPRNKGGVGVGSEKQANPAKDGIEVKLRDLARDVPSGIGKEVNALEETGWYIAAMAELSNAKGWAKPAGKKTKASWKEFADEMHKLGQDFAKAAKAGGAQEIKSAAAKVNANCTNCHSIFKE